MCKGLLNKGPRTIFEQVLTVGINLCKKMKSSCTCCFSFPSLSTPCSKAAEACRAIFFFRRTALIPKVIPRGAPQPFQPLSFQPLQPLFFFSSQLFNCLCPVAHLHWTIASSTCTVPLLVLSAGCDRFLNRCAHTAAGAMQVQTGKLTVGLLLLSKWHSRVLCN